MDATHVDKESIPGVDRSTTSEAAPLGELDQLAFFVGRWHGDGTFFAGLGFSERPIEMTVEVTRELGGAWYVTHTVEHAGDANPDPLRAMYIWGYDAATRQFVAYWFDSKGGRAIQTSSGWTGDTLIFTGEMTAGGFTFPLRDTFVKQGARAYHHRGEAYFEGRWITVDEEKMIK